MAIFGLGVESRSALFFLSWVVPTKKIRVSDFELPRVSKKSQCLCNLLGCQQLHPKKGLGFGFGVFSTNVFFFTSSILSEGLPLTLKGDGHFWPLC